MEIIPFLPAAAAGYYTMRVVTHPTKSRIRRKMPKIAVKRLEVLPHIRIRVGDRVIHFHHWFNFSVLLVVSAFVTSAFLDSIYTRGFLTGGIVQGLLLKEGYGRRIYYHKHFEQQVSSRQNS